MLRSLLIVATPPHSRGWADDERGNDREIGVGSKDRLICVVKEQQMMSVVKGWLMVYYGRHLHTKRKTLKYTITLSTDRLRIHMQIYKHT